MVEDGTSPLMPRIVTGTDVLFRIDAPKLKGDRDVSKVQGP
jgi:hypothetical protein